MKPMDSQRPLIIALILTCGFMIWPTRPVAARTVLRNICRVKGQEENVLRGLGLVLPNYADRSGAVHDDHRRMVASNHNRNVTRRRAAIVRQVQRQVDCLSGVHHTVSVAEAPTDGVIVRGEAGVAHVRRR